MEKILKTLAIFVVRILKRIDASLPRNFYAGSRSAVGCTVDNHWSSYLVRVIKQPQLSSHTNCRKPRNSEFKIKF